jgi:hypothetical protein
MNPTQLLATIEVGPAHVLREAKTYIATYGWHQGDMFATVDEPCPPACAAGAIRFVVAGNALPFDYAVQSGDRDLERLYDLFMDAVDVLAWYLINTGAVPADATADMFDDGTTPYDIVADWNDDPARNVAQIVAVLNGAADEWDRMHTSEGAR